jgi:hypothetical protein
MLPKADVLYIGYPKAASVFVGKYLQNHPEVTTDYGHILPLVLPSSPEDVRVAAEKPNANSIHVSRDEAVAESLCIVGDPEKWIRYRYIPGAWDSVKDDIVVDPVETATRLRNAHPDSKVLMVIREQVDWLNSIYKYSLSQLPSTKRSFSDYCYTPYGAVVLRAGHYDLTIRAYIDIFGADRVCVLRYEDLVYSREKFSDRLCAFIGISQRPISLQRANESHAQIANFQRIFPFISRLPRKVKDAIKPRAARLLPGARRVILSSTEIGMVRSQYAVSNRHTEKLIDALAAFGRHHLQPGAIV